MMLPEIPLPSSDHYVDRNCTGPNPCIICGRDVKNPRLWLHIVNGGITICDPSIENHPDSQGDCGLYAIGAGCIKAFPHLRPYVLKWAGPATANPAQP